MTDMDLDDAEFDHLDLDDLIKLEEEATVVGHNLMADRAPSNMSIVTSTEYTHETTGHYLDLESEVRNLKHEIKRMQRKLQEQDDTIKRKDQESIGLKQQLSMLRQKAAVEKKAFPAQKPIPKKTTKRHTDTQPGINSMKRIRLASSASSAASSIPSTPPAPTPSTLALAKPPTQEGFIKLLRTLYFERLYERNKTYVLTKEAQLWLSSATRNQLTDEFMLKLIPRPATMSTDQFGLVMHEIKSTLLESSQLGLTMTALMHQINLCLSLSVKHQLYLAVKNIVTAIYRLLKQFPSMIRTLSLDLLYSPSSSLVYTMADALNLFGYRKQSQHDHLFLHKNQQTSISDIKLLRRQYHLAFSDIADRIRVKKVPTESYSGTSLILDVFRHLSQNYQEPLFDFLIAHDTFLSFLSPNTPLDILTKALSILNTNLRKSQFPTGLNVDENKPLSIARQLFVLLNLTSTGIGREKLYKLRIDIFQVLQRLCRARLPLPILLVVQRETYEKSMDLMRIETAEMKKLLTKAERRKQAVLIAKCFDMIHTVIKVYREDLFEFYKQNESYNLLCISNLVLYMFKQISESHPAYLYVAAVETLLNRHVQSNS